MRISQSDLKKLDCYDDLIEEVIGLRKISGGELLREHRELEARYSELEKEHTKVKAMAEHLGTKCDTLEAENLDLRKILDQHMDFPTLLPVKVEAGDN